MVCVPGFIDEALKTLTLKTKYSGRTIFCNLVIDEMAIRQHLEFDGKTYYGRVDLGNGLESDSLEMAKECLVFMVVAVNENWKLPIGYFLTSTLNSSQRCELVRHAMCLLQDTGVNIISLTFDGCSTNVTMAKLLGCNLNIDNLLTTCTFSRKNNVDMHVEIILDPAHMIKLIRNAFGEKKMLLDLDNNLINYSFIQDLFLLQENEGSFSANKISKQHIYYFKQKMKVKLATQLLSQSVAHALRFCNYNLNLEQFKNSDATIKFIELFNTAFDICNSRSINCVRYKKAMSHENFLDITNFVTHFTQYIQGLKIKEHINDTGFVPVL